MSKFTTIEKYDGTTWNIMKYDLFENNKEEDVMNINVEKTINWMNKRREDLTYPKNLYKKHDWAHQQELNTINRIQNMLEGKEGGIKYNKDEENN